MANHPVLYVFQDNRMILQGPKVVLPLYSTPDAAHHQHDWLDINSSEHEQQDHPPSPLPHEVDGATRVVCLGRILSPDDLRDHVFYQEVLEEITEEVCKYGDLLEVVIPRPGDPEVSGGVGKVFLKYACLDASVRCLTMLDRRWFARRCIVPRYYPEDRFAAGDYGYDG